MFPELFSLADYAKELIGCNDALIQHKYTAAIRELISAQTHPPIADFIQCGVVPTIVGFLEPEFACHPQLQEDALWFLTNLVSSTSMSALSVVNERLIVLLLQFVESTNVPLIEQSVWVLANIVCDSVRWRDCVLNKNILGIFQYLFALCIPTLSSKLAWCMSNLCLTQPRPSWKHVKVDIFFCFACAESVFT